VFGLTARTLTVGEDADAAVPRLDAFVSAVLPELSRRLVRRLIAEGGVRVNGRRAPKGLRLRAGDRVTVPDLPTHLEPEPDLPIAVVYEDVHLVALDKPGGTPAHALDPRQRGTAAAFLLARYPEMATIGDHLAAGLVHRLDTGTSGLLLAARTAGVYLALRAAFRARTVEKWYLAVVAGCAAPLHGLRTAVPLAHDPRDRRRLAPAAPGTRGWPAETRIEVLDAGQERSVVQARIRTGLTHQVRAHLALLGHPVLGDRLYGGPPADLPPDRHALHAAAITLPHPTAGRPLHLSCAPPGDLHALLG
jgi:23S rRNA pseudouridine1911/1915/1917 synthase